MEYVLSLLSGYSVWQLGAALAATLGSAFVRGLTGFGMAILLVPILALTLPPVESVIVANFLSLLIGLVEIKRLVTGAEKTAWSLSLLVLIFTPLGLYALAVTSPDIARFVIALIALSAFAAILIPRKTQTVPGRAATGIVGLISGLMTGYAGMPGPPVVPYYVGRNLPRETAKTSMMLVFTAAGLAGITSAIVLGLVRLELALLAAALFPAVLIGNKIGHGASGRIGDTAWRTFVGLVLAGAALAALLRLL